MTANYQAYLNGRRLAPANWIVVRVNGHLVTFDQDAVCLAQKLGVKATKTRRYWTLRMTEGDLGSLNGTTELVNVVSAD